MGNTKAQYTKKLCVVYMCCTNEIQSGALQTSLELLISKITKYRYDLHVCTEFSDAHRLKTEISSLFSEHKYKNVQDTYIHSVTIPAEYNVFITDYNVYNETGRTLPPLGLSHGPNQLFYDGMKQVMNHDNNYDNILLLESDAQIVADNWFENCVEICKSNSDFVVAGSVYKGISSHLHNKQHEKHINGVAIYRNDYRLKLLLELSEQYIRDNVSVKQPLLNYDVANYLVALEHAQQEFLINVEHIVNCSTAVDIKLPNDKIAQQHPRMVILHKKFPVNNTAGETVVYLKHVPPNDYAHSIYLSNISYFKDHDIQFHIIDPVQTDYSVMYNLPDHYKDLTLLDKQQYLMWYMLSTNGGIYLEKHVILCEKIDRRFTMVNKNRVDIVKHGDDKHLVACMFEPGNNTSKVIFNMLNKTYSEKTKTHRWKWNDKITRLNNDIIHTLKQCNQIKQSTTDPIYISTWRGTQQENLGALARERIRTLRKNTWMATVLICTSAEYARGQVHRCLDNYIQPGLTQGKQKCDLLIYIDTGDLSNYLDLIDRYQYKHPFEQVTIHVLNIPDEFNVYIKQDQQTPEERQQMWDQYQTSPEKPPLGMTSGPNILFLNTMEQINYNHFYEYCLWIEPDTRPTRSDWLDHIVEYVQNTKFIVAGSMYYGKYSPSSGYEWNSSSSGHLNGVGIYRTSRSICNHLWSRVKQYIQYHVKNKWYAICYDMALHEYSCTREGKELYGDRDNPEDNIITSPLFVNLSTIYDKDIPNKTILDKHPKAVIIHQKF